MTEPLDIIEVEKLIEDTEAFLAKGNEHVDQIKETIEMISKLQDKVNAYGGDWKKLIEEGGYSPEQKKEIAGFMKTFNEESQKLFEEQTQAKASKAGKKKFSKNKARSFKL